APRRRRRTSGAREAARRDRASKKEEKQKDELEKQERLERVLKSEGTGPDKKGKRKTKKEKDKTPEEKTPQAKEKPEESKGKKDEAKTTELAKVRAPRRKAALPGKPSLRKPKMPKDVRFRAATRLKAVGYGAREIAWKVSRFLERRVEKPLAALWRLP